MKNKKHLLISLLILCVAAVVGLTWSIIDFKVANKVMSYSYEVIQFDYDGASDGVDPNGKAFNPTDLLTDEVIEEALNESSLTYDIELVRQNIFMENIVPKDIVKEIQSYESIIGKTDDSSREISSKDYRPVRYKFVLYNDLDKKLSKAKLNELLDNIVNAYCDHFYDTYKKNYDISSYSDLYQMENYDYIYQAEVFTNKIRVLSNCARSIYNEHTDFTVDGKSFNDLALKCDQLISSDVSRINNIIILNALSKDIERLKNYYNFKIENLNFEKIKYTSDLATITAQLNAYTKDSTVYVGSGENIVKVDNNSSVTYDSLLAKQIATANTIASINTSISDYQAILEDINNAVATDEDYTLVQNYITRLSNEYDSLENSFKDMTIKYNEKYINNSSISKSEVKYYSASIASTTFIARCIKICAPIGIEALLIVSFYLLIIEIRKNKKNN